jgi:hypothetical protein
MKRDKIKAAIKDIIKQINEIAADGGIIPWNDPLEIKLKSLRKQLKQL